jgi:hypothetical protein
VDGQGNNADENGRDGRRKGHFHLSDEVEIDVRFDEFHKISDFEASGVGH